MLAYDSVYCLLFALCESFSGDILICVPGIRNAVEAVLVHPKVKELFWKSAPSKGLWSLVQEIIKHFPHQYSMLVGIVRGLAEGDREYMPQVGVFSLA